MKNLIVMVSLLTSVLAFSQFQKTELTSEEIHFLAKAQYKGPLGTVEENVPQYMVSLNNTLFIYELTYMGQPLYTGGLNKWNPSSLTLSNGEMQRKRTNLSLVASQIQMDDLLILLEDRSWKQSEIDGIKYISNESLDLFLGSGREGYTANEPIPGKLVFKFYKLTE